MLSLAKEKVNDMNILLFGVTNVGKTTTGQIMADILEIEFYDIDEVIKKKYNTTLEEFVKTGTLEERDEKRGRVLRALLKKEANKVIAVTPMSYPEYFEKYTRRSDVIAIELRDTVENIFERLVFSDENDVIYRDDEYKNARKNHYMREIAEDLIWYGGVYRNIANKYDINNEEPSVVAKALIERFNLRKLCIEK